MWKGCKIESFTAENGQLIPTTTTTIEDDDSDDMIKILEKKSESLEGDSQKTIDVKNKIIEKVRKYLFHECESPFELSTFEFLIDHGINIVSK